MNLTDINQIKDLLGRHGFRFSKSLGQNFLCAAWVPEDIADAALLDGETGVLEVGPGVGCLTVQLAQRAKKVVSIELDKALMPVLAETLAGYDNAEVVFGDVMKTDLAALCREKFTDCARVVVCANLPYNITTPAITALLESKCFESITVLVQKEVAERIDRLDRALKDASRITEALTRLSAEAYSLLQASPGNVPAPPC